ncbi:GDP-mannose pyrophosphorylase [Gracilaria domingensis]|nr:GDP-mannose pyrophosphorylase [Gracilaria domingensis]
MRCGAPAAAASRRGKMRCQRGRRDSLLRCARAPRRSRLWLCERARTVSARRAFARRSLARAYITNWRCHHIAPTPLSLTRSLPPESHLNAAPPPPSSDPRLPHPTPPNEGLNSRRRLRHQAAPSHAVRAQAARALLQQAHDSAPDRGAGGRRRHRGGAGRQLSAREDAGLPQGAGAQAGHQDHHVAGDGAAGHRRPHQAG